MSLRTNGVSTIPDLERVGRRERRKAITRQDLLLAGRKLFSEKGLYESRVEEITRTADIGKGTLYRYFRNKEALILAVVTAGFDELRHRVAERTTGAVDLDAIVAGMVAAHVGFFADNEDLMRIFHQVRGMLKFNRPEWRPFRKSLATHLTFLADELARDPEGRKLGPARRHEQAVVLFGSVSGSLSTSVASNPHAAIRPMAPALTAALVAMSAARSSRASGRATKGKAARKQTRQR